MIDLDHAGVAVRDAISAAELLVGRFGASVVRGGTAPGFRAIQLDLGVESGGMVLELLEPSTSDRADFLARFLERRGPGFHHLTFYVDELHREVARLGEAGYVPDIVNTADPRFLEIFLGPAKAHGTVVQLVQAAGDDEVPRLGTSNDPWWRPLPPRASDRLCLHRVVLKTADLSGARRLFSDVLRGEECASGPGWVELRWRSGRLRLATSRGAESGVTHGEYHTSGDVQVNELLPTVPLVRVSPSRHQMSPPSVRARVFRVDATTAGESLIKSPDL
jgi:methylmalonyl-CoA/ethylmalonyl-CoA epimerase